MISSFVASYKVLIIIKLSHSTHSAHFKKFIYINIKQRKEIHSSARFFYEELAQFNV